MSYPVNNQFTFAMEIFLQLGVSDKIRFPHSIIMSESRMGSMKVIHPSDKQPRNRLIIWAAVCKDE